MASIQKILKNAVKKTQQSIILVHSSHHQQVEKQIRSVQFYQVLISQFYSKPNMRLSYEKNPKYLKLGEADHFSVKKVEKLSKTMAVCAFSCRKQLILL